MGFPVFLLAALTRRTTALLMEHCTLGSMIIGSRRLWLDSYDVQDVKREHKHQVPKFLS